MKSTSGVAAVHGYNNHNNNTTADVYELLWLADTANVIEKLKDSHFMKANHILPENFMRYHYRPTDTLHPPPATVVPTKKYPTNKKALEGSSHEILCSEVNERQCSIEPSVSLSERSSICVCVCENHQNLNSQSKSYPQIS